MERKTNIKYKNERAKQITILLFILIFDLLTFPLFGHFLTSSDSPTFPFSLPTIYSLSN
jgi:hypothetical protein